MKIEGPNGKPLPRVKIYLEPGDEEFVEVVKRALMRFDGDPKRQQIIGPYGREMPKRSFFGRFANRFAKPS